MKTSVRWLGDMAFVGESGSGHAVVMDGPPEHGGRNIGIRPMEMLLLGMAACSGVDLVHILRKARQQVTGCEVRIEADRAETQPKVFTEIRAHYLVAGHGLGEKQVRRAVELSAEKYCSASIMLGKTARMSHSFEIVEA